MKGWSYTFTAAKGQKGMHVLAEDYLNRVLSTLALGEEFGLTIFELQDKRSSKANRALWGPVYDSILLQLADAVGYDRHERSAAKELIHEGLTGKYGGYETCPVTKREVRKFRTSKATKQQFTDYIEWVARYCAEEYGIVVELPGERL